MLFRKRKKVQEEPTVSLPEPTTPKILHRYWTGSVKPEYVEQYGKKLRELHPDWEVHDWTPKDIPESIGGVIRASNKLTVGRDRLRNESNIVRYWLLREFGGVWVDTDIEPLRNFDCILGDVPIFASIYDKPEGAFIASPPGHELFGKLVHRASRPGRLSSIDRSGAGLLGKTLREFPDVELLPATAVFDFDAFGNEMSGSVLSGGPIARHVWAASRNSQTRKTVKHKVVGQLDDSTVMVREMIRADAEWIRTLKTPLGAEGWVSRLPDGPVVVSFDEQPIGVALITSLGTSQMFEYSKCELMQKAVDKFGASLVRL